MIQYKDRIATRKLLYTVEANDYIDIDANSGDLYAKVKFDAENDDVGQSLKFIVNVQELPDKDFPSMPLLGDRNVSTNFF